VDTLSDISEEFTASIFRVRDLLRVVVKVIQSKKCVSYFGLLEGLGPSRVWETRRGNGFGKT
jgi:hypothetical protein